LFDIATNKNSYRFIDFIKPEFHKAYKDATHRTQNFLKHADKDPDAQLEYSQEQTYFTLWEAVQTHKHLGNRPTPEHGVYIAWFMARYPEIVDATKLSPELQKAWADGGLDPSDWDLYRRKLAELKRTAG
jgi:hypothetical protein